MKNFKPILSKTFAASTVLAFALGGMTLTGCQTTPADPSGAPAAKAAYEAGMLENQQITDQFFATLADLTAGVPPLQAAVLTSLTLPYNEVLKTEMDGMLGVWTESGGKFSRGNTALNNAVVVNYADGSVLTMNLDPLASYQLVGQGAQRLQSFTLDVTSGSGLNLDLTVQRLNAVSQLTVGNSQGLRITGEATFVFNGTATTFRINDLFTGEVQDTVFNKTGGVAVTRNFTNINTNANSNFNHGIFYGPSSSPGTLVKVGENETFVGSGVDFRATIGLRGFQTQGTQASFQPAAAGTVVFGLAPGGLLRQNGITYAYVKGGPMTCDYTTNTDISGTPITIEYIDGTRSDIWSATSNTGYSCTTAGIPAPV